MYARELVSTSQAGVNQICKLLGISKDSYYNSSDPHSSLTTKYAHLKPKIRSIIKSDPCYGYPRIKIALEKRFGRVVNHKLLLKLMRAWNLSLPRKIRKKKPSVIAKALKFLESRANLVRKLLSEDKLTNCFQVVVSDMTEIETSFDKAYLCVHMDYIGKLVYGYKLGLRPTRHLMIASFSKAVKRLKYFGITNLAQVIFHSDRGTQYTSLDYVAAVLSTNASLSYSKKAEPGDNAVNEAFFSRLKEEWREIFAETKSFEELEQLVKNTIEYYNERRYHTSINNLTPLEFTKAQAQGVSR